MSGWGISKLHEQVQAVSAERNRLWMKTVALKAERDAARDALRRQSAQVTTERRKRKAAERQARQGHCYCAPALTYRAEQATYSHRADCPLQGVTA